MKIRHILLLFFVILLFINGCSATKKKSTQFISLDDIKSIISKNPAKINERNEFGYSLLHIAVLENKIEIVKYLISQGANVNALDDFNETPLYKALRLGETETVKYLAIHGSNINAKNI